MFLLKGRDWRRKELLELLLENAAAWPGLYKRTEVGAMGSFKLTSERVPAEYSGILARRGGGLVGTVYERPCERGPKLGQAPFVQTLSRARRVCPFCLASLPFCPSSLPVPTPFFFQTVELFLATRVTCIVSDEVYRLSHDSHWPANLVAESPLPGVPQRRHDDIATPSPATPIATPAASAQVMQLRNVAAPQKKVR